jgi:hypothetical protein
MRYLPLLALAASCAPVDPAVRAGMEFITPERMRRHLSYIASDELEGRLAGRPGNDKATEYIAGIYKASGMAPLGADYYQPFMAGKRNPAPTRNTLAVLEGTDLKDQVLMVGAHHDHVGRKGQRDVGRLGTFKEGDDIWNGADDNGSGTTCLITIVEAFKASGVRPRRTIVFATWSAEEWGLLGSKHYCDHPVVPLERTIAYFNMDMMGRGGSDRPTHASGVYTEARGLFRPLVERAAWAARIDLRPTDYYGPGSDHVSFAQKKVPVISFAENGPCPDYHRVTDEPDRINYDYMAGLARAVFYALVDLGNRDSLPVWNESYSPPQRRRNQADRPRLGIGAEALTRQELDQLGLRVAGGAIYVSSVSEDSVAKTAGLQEGDVIVSIAGKTFPEEGARSALSEILDKTEKGVEVPLEYYRKGQLHKIAVVWPK